MELAGVFEQVLGKRIVVRNETTPRDVEGWDSLAHVTLIVATERRFGIKFRGTEIANTATVGDLIALIEAKIRLR